VRKISPPPGFEPRTVQPVGKRYTNYAVPAHVIIIIIIIIVYVEIYAYTNNDISPYIELMTEHKFLI
jgi:hypothetical protein